MSLIEIQNVSKTFFKSKNDEHTVLDDLSFSVKKGECFAIIGPNGSGKTTLLRILGLLERPSKGTILYKGKNITNLSKKEIVVYRQKFSFVRQKPVVLNVSVANNIAYGLKIREMEKSQIILKVKEIIDLVGLKNKANANARSLSGGEMQRVVIAMNFILTPEIYLLDEISANLDPKNVSLLESFITKIKQDKTKTMILSTHNPLEAIKFADRIGVLNDGKLIQIDTPEKIFTYPKDEFTAQFVGYENIFNGFAKFDLKSGLNHVKVDDLTVFTSDQKEGHVKVCIRPESIVIAKNAPDNTSFCNSFKGKIENIRELGNICHIFIKTKDQKFLSSITKESSISLNLKPESEIYFNFKATDVKCL